MRKNFSTRLAMFLALILSAGGLAWQAAETIPGFSASGAASERELEESIFSKLDPDMTGRHFRYLTEEPHVAGSERNYQLALYTRDRFKEYGLENVDLRRYDVYLPLPRAVSVRMTEPIEYEASLKEDGYPADKDSYASEVGISYLGMSASGDVTAPVIYAHSGNPSDYDWLESQGIDPRGKIAIVRYSVPYSYRGFKAWEAERRGVKALIIYSDPMEDGYRKGDVFPEGPWGPESHIQRGAITYDFIVPGDPLTPGWASVEGAQRIPIAEARSVPHVIAVAISWRDAKPLLENLGGPVAPYDWQGGLPITYHVGPGASAANVRVDMDDETRPIWVVTGEVQGSQEPEQRVILGNHRDAWVYGAVDPSSGTATLLELARVLGKMKEEGQRPRRTVTLASWDAEEWHLTGSTEWGEEFARSLSDGGIAYLNVDSSTAGPEFTAGAVASLSPILVSVLKDVRDPNSRGNVLDAWRRRKPVEDDVDLVENELGSGSDYTVFLNRLGIPIVEMTFDGPYGVYHSQYDDYYWMTHFGDPGFRYMTAMAEVWGRLALRLANADVLPLDFALYADRVSAFLGALEREDGVPENLDLGPAKAAAADWSREAIELNQAIGGELLRRGLTPEAGGVSPGADRLREVNELLLTAERTFLLDDGIPGRPWFKHALYAPRYTYAAMSLPGVQEAVEDKDWGRARSQLALLTSCFETMSDLLGRAAASLH
jgi:N-acetylated-alpha-linked acidic dipeptidase